SHREGWTFFHEQTGKDEPPPPVRAPRLAHTWIEAALFFPQPYSHARAAPFPHLCVLRTSPGQGSRSVQRRTRHRVRAALLIRQRRSQMVRKELSGRLHQLRLHEPAAPL